MNGWMSQRKGMRSEAACVGPSIVLAGARGRAEGGQDVMRERSGHTGARGVWCGDGRNQEMRKGPEAVGADERHGTHLATPCAFSLLTLWPSMSIDVLCVKSIRKHRELWATWEQRDFKFTEILFPIPRLRELRTLKSCGRAAGGSARYVTVPPVSAPAAMVSPVPPSAASSSFASRHVPP